MAAAKSSLRILLALVALVALNPAQARAQSASSEDERRILNYIDAHTQEAIKLLEQTVNIKSATLNLEGVRSVGRVFGSELEQLGFAVKWIEMPREMNRAGHLFAERTSERGKRLLLIGHLDTVLEGSRFERAGNRARGNGTADMKGGDVVLLFALKALKSVGALDTARIIVILTGDEELPGAPLEISRRDLIEAGKRSDAALAFETGVADTATVARRGSSLWRLRVTGVTGHSSGIFGQGVGSGAVFEAARILTAFHEQLKGEQYLTFNPSVIVGGTEVSYDTVEKKGTAEGKPNVIAQTAVVEGDLRFISEEQKVKTREKMREIVSKNLARTKAEITFEDLYPAMPPTEGNYALLKILDEASRDHNLGKVEAYDPGRRGAGDVSFVAPFVSGLDGLGVRGSGAHEPDELVDLDSLAPAIKRAALLIFRLTR